MSSTLAVDIGDGQRLAYARCEGAAPELLFCSGFRSDMTGTKALALEAQARGRGWAFTRFDYRGHGASSGSFEEGCIGDWLADTLAMLDRVATAPAVLVGSSMGGWLALLAARARPSRVAGLVLVAPAPDFTARLIEPALTPEAKAELAASGLLMAPSAYGEPYPITRRLLEDGRRHLLLDGAIAVDLPVHILHGQADAEVPWQLSLELAAKLAGARVTVELVKDGDHRLSRPEDLRRLGAAVERVRAQAKGDEAP